MVASGPASLVVEGLSHRYRGAERPALSNVSVAVEPGARIGLLGPNGAGKSTLMRLLCGYLLIGATANTKVEVAGLDVRTQSQQVRERVGYMPEHVPLYYEMRAEEHLRFRARIKRVPRAQRASEVQRVAELTGIKHVLLTPIGQLSRGYRQRVGLADALIGSPPLVVLDEPTVGLDPNQVRDVRAMLRELGGAQTLMFSSHILAEVEMLCDRVVILSEGQVVADETIGEATTAGAVHLALDAGPELVSTVVAAAAKAIGAPLPSRPDDGPGASVLVDLAHAGVDPVLAMTALGEAARVHDATVLTLRAGTHPARGAIRGGDRRSPGAPGGSRTRPRGLGRGGRGVSRAAGQWVSGAAAIAHRELLSLFVTPLAYVVGTLFLLLQGWNFALLLRVLNDPLAAPGPVMQFFFSGSFFIFWLPVIFLCAAVSMRLVAEERKQGTLEALLTTPLSPSQVAVGKFAGALGLYSALWSPTVIFYLLLRGAGVDPDPGPILSGYYGTLMVGASFIGIGLLASALTRSQLSAAIATFVACTIMLLAGLLVEQVQSPWLTVALERTSLLSMMQELAQGIVDGRWAWLHGSIVVCTVAAAAVAIDPRRDMQRLLQLALLVLAAGHVAWLGMRHAERDDWTGGRVYSLSERAEAVLRSLPADVDVRVVVPTTIGGGRPNPLAGELREVLTRMSAVTARLRVTILDPDRDRQEAEQLIAEYGLGGRDLADGVVLIRAGQGASLRKVHLVPGELVTYATGPQVQATGPSVEEFRGEEALLGAFVRVTDPTRTTVCITQGHGEPGLDNLEPYGGYAHLDDLLTDAGLIVHTADLTEADGLSTCDVVMVAGPGGPLPAAHVQAIEAFASKGGDLLLMTGAVVLPGAAGLAPHGLEPLVASYGVGYGNRIVLDPNGMPGGTPLLTYTLVDGWGDHPAVRSLVGRPASFVFVRELTVDAVPGAEDPVILMQTSADGWAESDIGAIRTGAELDIDIQADAPGPIPLAVAAERGGSRLVVIASDQFALNALLRPDVVYDHGRDLVLNVVGWLADRDVLLGIRPRAREHVKLVLRPEQLQRMTLLCLLGLPGFGVLTGLWVLWRRRR